MRVKWRLEPGTYPIFISEGLENSIPTLRTGLESRNLRECGKNTDHANAPRPPRQQQYGKVPRKKGAFPIEELSYLTKKRLCIHVSQRT